MLRRSGLLAVLVVAFVVVAAVNSDCLELVMARAAGSSPRVQRDTRTRVTAARLRLKESLPALFAAQGVTWPPSQVFLRAIKENDDGTPGVVELWARNQKSASMSLIKSYPICRLSGTLGPKRRQGDFQIPEGFYTITKLNPTSSYHLSMRVDYPNASDRIRGRALAKASERADVDLGGDIMVHGSCVTIGCIPLQDEPIEEVFLAADAAFKNGPLPIHIFPRRLDAAGLERLLATTTDPTLQAFWRELAVGYQGFEATRAVPRVTVAKDGAYVVAGAPVGR